MGRMKLHKLGNRAPDRQRINEQRLRVGKGGEVTRDPRCQRSSGSGEVRLITRSAKRRVPISPQFTCEKRDRPRRGMKTTALCAENIWRAGRKAATGAELEWGRKKSQLILGEGHPSFVTSLCQSEAFASLISLVEYFFDRRETEMPSGNKLQSKSALWCKSCIRTRAYKRRKKQKQKRALTHTESWRKDILSNLNHPHIIFKSAL